jgi:acyl-CoA reductase-like NAD-dependent aldehyde dehydrogenase
MLGPIVDKIQFEKVMGYIDHGKEEARLITGGNQLIAKGLFIQPTIFLVDSKSSSAMIYREEIFGPVLTI